MRDCVIDCRSRSAGASGAGVDGSRAAGAAAGAVGFAAGAGVEEHPGSKHVVPWCSFVVVVAAAAADVEDSPGSKHVVPWCSLAHIVLRLLAQNGM